MVFRHRRGLACGRLDFSSTPAKPVLRCLPLILAALLVAARPAYAVTHASILVDARTGQVLEADNADALAHPASLTKLMTLYLTFQRLQSGQLTIDSELYVSRHAAEQSPTKLWLRAGSMITVQSAILGITTVSANDAAVALAENIGGSESGFVDLMNQEARRLGMTNTTFCNASGLPNYGQWTTARDMSTLALALIHTFPQYYHFFGAPDFSFNGRMVDGHDWLLDEYPGVDGMKTGYIYSSGFNIVTSAVRDDRRLVGVVLGGRSARARDLQMIGLLDQGFATPAASSTLVASAAAPAPDLTPAAVETQSIHPTVEPLRPAAERMRPAAYHRDFARPHAWTIQVGSGFRTPYSVDRILRSARRVAPTPLRRGRPEVIRLRRSDYLARFSDLSYPMAERACSALHARRFSCRILPHTIAHRSEIVNAAAAILPTGE
jgi:D-alanyl-D-alanine carboxypeptidase